MSAVVVCVHLLNDYSGSPRVLAHSIVALRRRGVPVELCVAESSEPGVLDGLDVTYRFLPYKRSSARLVTLARFLYAQVHLFITVLGFARRNVILYVNTLLPFGAAVAGYLIRKKVIYHVHETYVRPRALKWFLSAIAARCSTRRVFVSKYLLDAEGGGGICVHNSLSPELESAASAFVRTPNRKGALRVLMACSLRDYKGIPEFLEVARRLVDKRGIEFALVINASAHDINEYFAARSVPPNVTLSPTVRDMRQVYEHAHVLLNLSRPDECVETFGLTLLEGMAFGLPVVAPPIGGPAELVVDGVSGYLLSCHEPDRITAVINELAASPERYAEMSREAARRARDFSSEAFERRIVEAVLG